MRFSAPAGPEDYRDEPTELLPNGLPADGYVAMKVSQEPFAHAPAPKTSSSSLPQINFGAADFAATKLMNDHKEEFPPSRMGPFSDPPRVQIGESTIYSFTFHITPRVFMVGALADDLLAKDAPFIPSTNLPANFKKLIAQQLAKLEKEFEFENRESDPIHP